MALADKTISGLRAIAERWSGDITLVGESVAADSGNLGVHSHDRGSLESALGLRILTGSPSELLRATAPDVVQISLATRDAPLQRLGIPHVVVAENTAAERFRYARPSATRSALARMALGAARQEMAQRQMVRRASALACNGWAAWRAYARLAAGHRTEPLFFLDSRVTRAHIAAARRARATQATDRAPLRLAFSGRLHPAKGPQFAVEVSRRLRVAGVAHTLTILGDGPMRAALEEQAGPDVTFLGSLPFDGPWTDYVSHQVDLMLLPHTQGDPSGTYLESAAMGAPVLGFANAALRGHAEHGGYAWVVPLRDVDALTATVRRLALDRRELHERAEAGLRKGQEFGFESEFDERVSQLEAVAKGGR